MTDTAEKVKRPDVEKLLKSKDPVLKALCEHIQRIEQELGEEKEWRERNGSSAHKLLLDMQKNKIVSLRSERDITNLKELITQYLRTLNTFGQKDYRTAKRLEELVEATTNNKKGKKS